MPLMEHLLDIKDAAQFLNVSVMTIRRWTNAGKLKCFRVGRKRERRFYMRDLEDLPHDSKGHRLKPLGLGGRERVPGGAHMTHFYAGKEDAHRVSIPYLLEGIERGEVLLVVMPPEGSSDLFEDMERKGHPVGNWLERGRLCVSDGMGSPEEMVRYLGDFAARAHEFRVLGDMIWTVRKGWEADALSALEQSFPQAPPVEKGLFLCQYSLEDFAGTTIMMAAEWHRQTIYKERVEKSPFYGLGTSKQGDRGSIRL